MTEPALDPVVIAFKSDAADERAQALENKVAIRIGPRLAKSAREDERKRWPEFVAGSVSAACATVQQALKMEHDKHITELRTFHATHLREVRWGRFWLGMAAGSVLMAIVLAVTASLAYERVMLTTAAATAIESRGSVEPAPLTIRDGEGDFTTNRSDGFARGREPASAP